jgi:hypothetical protein
MNPEYQYQLWCLRYLYNYIILVFLKDLVFYNYICNIYFQIEDSAGELDKKCEILAKAIEEADNVIVYTGAGISTVSILYYQINLK